MPRFWRSVSASGRSDVSVERFVSEASLMVRRSANVEQDVTTKAKG